MNRQIRHAKDFQENAPENNGILERGDFFLEGKYSKNVMLLQSVTEYHDMLCVSQ